MKRSHPTLDLPGILPAPWSEPLGTLPLAPEHLYPLLDPLPHEGLLLSGGNHPLSCYSYMGLDPFLVVTASGDDVTLLRLPEGTSHHLNTDPFDLLQELLQMYRQDPVEGAPPFWGGGIGYFSYEMGRLLERLPCETLNDLHLPEFYFVFYRSVLTFSHRDRTYQLFGVRLNGEEEPPDGPRREQTRKRVLAGADRTVPTDAPQRSTLPLSLQSHFTREQYMEATRKALDYIVEGDIYQVNFSQRFRTPYNGDPYDLFLTLFQINPAPFFAYLNPGPFQILSSSPERFLFVKDGEAETRPIKGTLPRGRNPEEDRENSERLLRSEKNRAELAMITDLLRNDLGRVCEYGSVRVREAAQLETYTNVFHLVSVVTGTLARDSGRVDLLRATFPGGSITGCPKIRSMEIIDELEPTVRSVYTGSIGYLGWDGTMDLNIAIRSFIVQEPDLYFQVGGGIVYDSDPLAEYEETLHKAASMKQALEKTCRPER